MTTSDIAALDRRKAAMKFIVCLGLVSLFADMTYEGAYSAIGPFLKQLGASGAMIGFFTGLGEMFAASLRYFSGRFADRTRAYWTLAIAGYILNLLAVPALAFAGHWQMAAFLFVCERTGKAIRGPSRDVLLSSATAEVGHGWGFGIHGAMDQTGAVLGPLFVGFALLRAQHVGSAYLKLGIPAALALLSLIVAKWAYPSQGKPPKVPKIEVLPAVYWKYVAASSLLAFGYVDFTLLDYHWIQHSLITAATAAFLYAAAMGIEGLTGLAIGKLFDRYGVVMLSVGTLISMLSLPFGFLGGRIAMLICVFCWAFGLGTQDACLRSGIAQVVSMNKRGLGFGAFYAVWGVLWWLGSTLMGYLTDRNLYLLVAVGMAAQAAGAVLFLVLRHQLAAANRANS